MGRFNHEGVAVDPRTGIVYLTEDRGDGLIYRFIPITEGKLNGGKLQALVVRASLSGGHHSVGRVLQAWRKCWVRSEFAWGVFSRQGIHFFVNIQVAGLTVAIEGPCKKS